MSLKTIAGKLLRTAAGKLARACECCWRYCCVNVGQPDECGNYEQECERCPDGPKPDCEEPCPERPPCITQCVEDYIDECGQTVYECVHSTELIGLQVESCEDCPPPSPCEPDPYYCCYEFEPSQNPESPLPPKLCQLGPCSSPELHASGPHATLNQCESVCQNWYCCYDEQPSENPEIPLPFSTCQLGPCSPLSLQRSGPHASFNSCNEVCNPCNCSSEGFPPAIPSDAERGLVWLEFSSCIGSGVAGTVDAPPAVSLCDYEGLAGPITGVTLTNKGSGYARLGRVEPTMSASAGGTGATFTVTLEQDNEPLGDGCLATPYWKVASVSVSSEGASGYTDGESVSFTVANGDTEEVPAEATLAFTTPEDMTVTVTNGGKYYREDANEPPLVDVVTVTVQQESPSNGYGAVVTATVDDDTFSPTFGQVIALDVVDGGAGYLSPSAACDLPSKLYITWGDLQGEVSLDDSFIQDTSFGWVANILSREDDGTLSPPLDGIQYWSEAGDYRLVCAWNIPPEAGELYSVGVGFITGGTDSSSPIAMCKCGGKLHVQLGLRVVCERYYPFFDRIYIALYDWCFRFDVDENGCPVGDAVLVSTNWVAPDPEQNPCGPSCFERVDPVVSFMPP